MVVPDKNGLSVPVDLQQEDATELANRMYDLYHDIFGAFVVRPKERLPSKPVNALHELRIKIRDQMLSSRKTLGSFYLANMPYKYELCRDFIDEAEKSEKMLRQNMDNTADSYWLRTLNMAIEKAQDRKGKRYDIDASLFTPDSKNQW